MMRKKESFVVKTGCVDEARISARAWPSPGIGSNRPAIFHTSIYTINVHLCYDSNVLWMPCIYSQYLTSLTCSGLTMV